MPNPLKIPTWADEGYVNAVVETPRGITCKADFDPDPRVFTFAKPLMAGLTYPPHLPVRLGLIPSTKAEDGDPLDGDSRCSGLSRGGPSMQANRNS
jgi:inorganic pyrophosphatase